VYFPVGISDASVKDDGPSPAASMVRFHGLPDRVSPRRLSPQPLHGMLTAMATTIAVVARNLIDGSPVPFAALCSSVAVPPPRWSQSAGSVKQLHIYVNAETKGTELRLSFGAGRI
jgi:hypothetical protein